MARIVVTDGDQRASLAIVRSLGKAGHEVHVVSETGRSIAGASRYAQYDVPVPGPLVSPESSFFAVRAYTKKVDADLLIPVTEASLLSILPHRDLLSCGLPFPDIDLFRRLSDKAWLAGAAPDSGISVPETSIIHGPEEARRLSLGPEETYVLKPGRSVEGGQKLSVSYAEGREGVFSALRKFPPAAFPVLLQERIKGPGAGVFLLIWDDRLLAAFAHRRIREKPPSGGVSVVRESAALDNSLLEISSRFMREIGWQGVAMVEFKIDSNTGIPYLMEVNGRFWGSLQLAIDAGVDFPTILVDAALGKAIETPPEYRVGVRTRWLLGDLDHLLLRMTRTGTALDLPPRSPNRSSVLKDFILDFRPSTRTEVFRTSDPYPFFRELGVWIRDLWRR